MNIHIRLRSEMLERVVTFLKTKEVSLNAYQAALAAQIEAAHVDLGKESGAQVSGRNWFRGHARRRNLHARELRARMRDIAEVAKALDKAEFGSIAAHLRMPRENNYTALIAHAQAFLKWTAPLRQAFHDRGFAESFFTDMKNLLKKMEEAGGEKQRGMLLQMRSTQSLSVIAAKGLRLVRELRAIFRHTLRKKPGLLSAWQDASRIHAVPVRKPRGKKAQPAPVQDSTALVIAPRIDSEGAAPIDPVAQVVPDLPTRSADAPEIVAPEIITRERAPESVVTEVEAPRIPPPESSVTPLPFPTATPEVRKTRKRKSDAPTPAEPEQLVSPFTPPPQLTFADPLFAGAATTGPIEPLIPPPAFDPPAADEQQGFLFPGLFPSPRKEQPRR